VIKDYNTGSLSLLFGAWTSPLRTLAYPN